ncbi:MAG: leucine-rich repeat domain-containing protein, partial [Anaerotignum sp.]|nr:leucine-rich repeat domain-containing protein [Anaerotignum sp.]
MDKKYRLKFMCKLFLILAISVGAGAYVIENYAGGLDFGKPIAEGTFEENMTWKLSKKGALTLTGTGVIPDYNGLWMEENELDPEKEYAPWAEYMKQITKVVLDPEMTRIGENAFAGAENLKSMERYGELREIGRWAFAYTGLETLEFPVYINKIEPFAFQGCAMLKEVFLP